MSKHKDRERARYILYRSGSKVTREELNKQKGVDDAVAAEMEKKFERR